jgi:hypothetical protein
MAAEDMISSAQSRVVSLPVPEPPLPGDGKHRSDALLAVAAGFFFGENGWLAVTTPSE